MFENQAPKTLPLPKDCLHLVPPATLQFQHQFDHLFWIWNAPHSKFSPWGLLPSHRSRRLSLLHLPWWKCECVCALLACCVCYVCICACLGGVGNVSVYTVCAGYCVHKADINTLSMSMTAPSRESQRATDGLTITVPVRQYSDKVTQATVLYWWLMARPSCPDLTYVRSLL